jgi:hypothetical protein
MLINIKAIKGEEGTGYEPSVVKGKDLGEFECENCHFFKDGTCGQPDMVAHAKPSDLKNGRRVVDPEGCCEFVDRVGKTDTDENKFDIKNATWIK